MSWILAGGGLLLGLAGVGAAWMAIHNVRAATRSIEQVAKADTDAQLRLSVPQKDVEALLEQVNALLIRWRETERQHARRENELRQEMANISHDLRTPLTSVLGYLQLMQQADTPEADKQRYLTIVQQRATALQALITGLYDLSRLEAGGYTLEREPVLLSSLLVELTTAFYYDFQENGLEPDLAGVSRDLPAIRADRDAVVRIYTNLLQNALKHAQGGLRIEAYRENGWIRTAFSNAADGVSEQDIAHLFDRFYTADKMRTGHNTGLGLAIVKNLAEQMGGRVSARLWQGQLTIGVDWPLEER